MKYRGNRVQAHTKRAAVEAYFRYERPLEEVAWSYGMQPATLLIHVKRDPRYNR